jgi:hypothetical protein
MAKKTSNSIEEEKLLLQNRQVKALEKIANCLDALTIWFEEIDKQGWDDRLQYYLHEWHKNTIDDNGEEEK